VTYQVAALLSADVVGCINEVTDCWAGLLLRWVTILGYTVFLFNQATQASQAQPGQPSVGKQNEWWWLQHW